MLILRRWLLRMTAAWLAAVSLPLGAQVSSGLEIGAPTASIPVIDVTGPYQGQLICYVCEFQDAPNVLAFFRDTEGATADLIIELNALYLAHRDAGFQAVAAIVAGDDAKPWLEQLNAAHGLEIPLVVFRRGPRDVAARLYQLDPEVANTFLVTINRFVAANVAGIDAGGFAAVAEATTAMLAANTP